MKKNVEDLFGGLMKGKLNEFLEGMGIEKPVKKEEEPKWPSVKIKK